MISILALIGCSLDGNGRMAEKQSVVPIKIESVIFENNGAYSGKISSDESSETCRDFVLTESDVLEFFKISRSATFREYEHDLTASNCYAAGTFVAENSVAGTWKIDRARRGYLDVSGAESKYYYCGECKQPVFYESCDIDCINAE